MTAAKTFQNHELAAYERIRSHVIGQMAQAGASPMRMASYRELARRFAVSAPTVLRAVKDLVDDGFLVVRPGVGTFTNPARLDGTVEARLIGCFAGDGRNALMGRVFWHLLPPFMDAILRRSGRNRIQHGYLGAGGFSLAAMRRLGLGAAVWLSPQAAVAGRLRGLRERAGMSVLSIMGRCPGVSSLYFDDEAGNRAIAGRMLDEGRRRILLLLPPGGDEAAARGFAQAWAERGLACDPAWIRADSPQEQALFPRTVQGLDPDGIIFNCQITPYWPALQGTPGIVERCRLCTGVYPLSDDMGYVGWTIEPDLATDTALAAANLEAQFADPAGAEILDRAFTIRITARDDRTRTP